MRIVAMCAAGVVGAAVSVAGAQVGRLWSFDELTARADLVVIVEAAGTVDTGRRMEHPDLKPALPVAELATSFNVLAVLKVDPPATSPAISTVRLKHYRIDWDEWKRTHPPTAGAPPPGLVNTGSFLSFDAAGQYLLFLKRADDATYEPLSGQTFPTDSVYAIRKIDRPRP